MAQVQSHLLASLLAPQGCHRRDERVVRVFIYASICIAHLEQWAPEHR
jgi:hypothetical protein